MSVHVQVALLIALCWAGKWDCPARTLMAIGMARGEARPSKVQVLMVSKFYCANVQLSMIFHIVNPTYWQSRQLTPVNTPSACADRYDPEFEPILGLVLSWKVSRWPLHVSRESASRDAGQLHGFAEIAVQLPDGDIRYQFA